MKGADYGWQLQSEPGCLLITKAALPSQTSSVELCMQTVLLFAHQGPCFHVLSQTVIEGSAKCSQVGPPRTTVPAAGGIGRLGVSYACCSSACWKGDGGAGIVVNCVSKPPSGAPPPSVIA